jgi:hypothetical protein
LAQVKGKRLVFLKVWQSVCVESGGSSCCPKDVVFHDLAWQFEALEASVTTTMTLVALHDVEWPSRRSFASAWTKIYQRPGSGRTGNRDRCGGSRKI